MRFSHARRGFTLIELASVLAVAGIVTALGVAGVRSMIEAEQTRNTATQLAMDVRRHRMQAIQKQMYSRIEVASTADGVDIAYHATRTTSSPTTSPCTDMAAGVVKVGDVFEHRFYPRITATLTAVDGATTSTTTSACFTQRGLPVNDAATAYLQLALAAESSAGGPALNLEIDSNGNLASSDQTQNQGIAAIALHPSNVLAENSAPQTPNIDDSAILPSYETAPGVFTNVGGGTVAQTGDCMGNPPPSSTSGWPLMDLCGCGSSTCIYECTYSSCPPPCDVCYHDCCMGPNSGTCPAFRAAHPEFEATMGCPYYFYLDGCP